MGATGGDIETLTRRIIRQHPYPGFPWRSYHAEEDNVSFIALKCIGVAAYQSPLIDDLRLQSFKELVLNEFRLSVSLQANYAHGTASVTRIGDASHDLSHHRIGLRLIQCILTTASAIPIGHVANYKGL